MRERPIINCLVPGKPHPLERARSGKGRHYDTPENIAAKEKIQLFARFREVEPVECPVEVEIVCNYTRAHPTADVDNLAKTVLDAFNKYVFKDDKQVLALHVYKRGGQPADSTQITVTEIKDV